MLGRFFGILVGIAALLGELACGPAAAQSDGCTPAGGARARVSVIDDRSQIVLADGRVVALAGIDTARASAREPQLADIPRKTLHAWLVGHEVTVQPLVAAPDRWGRVVADVFAPADFAVPDEPPVSAAWMLVDAGLARTKPRNEPHACAAGLIAAEASARAAKLGLWQDPFYAVVDAGDEAALAERAGRFVLVEGEVTHIGNGRTRTFIDFGHGRGGFAAVVSKNAARRLEAAGISMRNLVGARLRVRGILDTRFGPRIDVAGPQDLERL